MADAISRERLPSVTITDVVRGRAVEREAPDHLRRLVGLMRIATICDGLPTPADEFAAEELALLDDTRRYLRERGVRCPEIGV